ncbi:hypothetical protein [Bradyrhizobium sp. BR 1432]
MGSIRDVLTDNASADLLPAEHPELIFGVSVSYESQRGRTENPPNVS